jgi:MOSC domain-containing protein YiiM
MRIESVNVGMPRDVDWRGETVATGIWKYPQPGRVAVRAHNLDGDRQADLRVHGGPGKAVYAYAVGHFAYWRVHLPGMDLPYGAFGENLTLDDFSEDAVWIDDVYRAGTARLVVTQPRIPCAKLGIRFDRADMPERFLASGRSGFYLAIVEAGSVAAGDEFTLLERRPAGVTVAEAGALYTEPDPDPGLLRRAIDCRALPEKWRERYRQRLRGQQDLAPAADG